MEVKPFHLGLRVLWDVSAAFCAGAAVAGAEFVRLAKTLAGVAMHGRRTGAGTWISDAQSAEGLQLLCSGSGSVNFQLSFHVAVRGVVGMPPVISVVAQ